MTFKTSRLTLKSETPISWTLDGESGGSYSDVKIINHKQAVRFIVMPDEKTAEQQVVNAVDAYATPIESILEDQSDIET